MIDLQIDITDAEDLRREKNGIVLDAIKSTAKAVLENSGEVAIKRSYENAPDDICRKYSAVAVFEKDWNQFTQCL